MAGKSDGQVIIETLIDTSGFEKIHKELKASTNDLNKIGKTVSTVGAGMTAALTVPVVALGKNMTEAAAEASAMKSQFSQVFGDLENNASRSLKGISDDTGIVEERIKGSYTQIAAFAKTSGLETAEALELSNRAMVAVADSAAFYDRSLEETAESLRSFLKGNYENDAALGLSATEYTRNAAAMELYGQSFNDLSEAQKQLTLLKMVEDANALSGALGQASRESDTWSNVTGNLNQEMSNLQATFGEHLLPVLVPVIQKLAELIEKFGEMDPKTQKVILIVGAVIAAIGPLATIIGGIATAVSAIIPIIGAVVGALNPVTLAIGAAVAAIALLVANWDTVKDAMQKFDDFLQNVFEKDFTKIFGPVLGGALNGFFASVKTIWESIKKIFNGIIDFITGVFSGNWEKAWTGIKDIFSGVWELLVSVTKTPINVIIGMINGLVSGVVEGINIIIRALNNLNFDIPDWVPFIGGEHVGFNIKEIVPPKIPYLASGAVIPPNAPFMAVLGDQKHGTNIEAPLDTIKQAVREVIGGNGGGNYHFTAQINRRTLFEEIIEEAKLRQSMTGRSPFELA